MSQRDEHENRGQYRVSVTKDYLVFASAHFITFSGHRCETLHGHNYRVAVTLEGSLDAQSWYVFDFGVLKRIMRKLCDDIDHKVLLAAENPHLQIAEDGDSVPVAYDNKPRYVFPKRDVALLPLPNTTVEMLAEMLTNQLQAEMAKEAPAGVTAIEMEVEENFGQSATFRRDVRSAS
jgi:6-pyruvoyltetrahydropterin/6-carboxytetrahydropterin synthase